MDRGICCCSKALRKHNSPIPPMFSIQSNGPRQVLVRNFTHEYDIHARWFASGVDGRDLEVLERVHCAVVTQQAKLIFPSD